MIGTPVSHLHAYRSGYVRVVTPLGLVAILKRSQSLARRQCTHLCDWRDTMRRCVDHAGRIVVWRILVRLLFLPVLTILTTRLEPVMAQGSPEPGLRQEALVRQEDLDSDGQPDLTVITTSYATDRDTVWVYDGAGDMRWGESWPEVTDFENDTWLFDVGSDGLARLVIRFTRDGENHVASVFQDLDGDAFVRTEIDRTRVTILESPYPSLTVRANGGWFLSDGQLNWNICFLTDGSVLHLHTHELTDQWKQILSHDGEPDVELEFRDGNLDGIPEYGLWRITAPTPPSWGATRTVIWANVGGTRPNQPSGSLFWPYLATSSLASPKSPGTDSIPVGAPLPQGINYFDSPTIVVVGFEEARILHITFPGYPIEHGFHLNTLQPFLKEETNYADSEIAQAYYDLAGDQDGNPELHIRQGFYGELDPYGWELGVPVNEIRWSWNQANSSGLSWDFKVSLAGRQAVTETIEFPDFSYYGVPYELLPFWVTDNSWDYATFVARENAAIQTTEGIYIWGAVETSVEGDPSLLSRYLAGELDVDLAKAFHDVPPGWRGELASLLQDRPLLYLSTIDRKLHLREADQGVWNLGGRTEVRYADLDSDGYLDQWLLLEGGVLARQLNFATPYLIYAQDGQVTIKLLEADPSLLETLPPRNQGEWLALDEQLKSQGRSFGPGDFESMMAQFEGAEWRVDGAEMRDFRSSEGGFRFILDLQPGFGVSGSSGPDLIDLQPGAYVLTYDEVFRVEPLTAPILHLDLEPRSASQSEGATALAGHEMVLEIRNDGLQDTEAVTLTVQASSPSGQVLSLPPQFAEVLAGGTNRLRVPWVPNEPGLWTFRADVLAVRPAAASVSPITYELEVAPAEQSDLWSSLGGFGLVPPWPLIGLFFAVAILGVAFLVGLARWVAVNPHERL